jgi:DNA-binding response OmpR family regulator
MAGSKTILCIEDDRFIADMYARSMRRAGFDVDVASTGTEGLRLALSKPYDVILLDIMLPEKQGTDILDELRGRENKVPNAKVIILTNFVQDDEAKAAMQSRVEGYLIKAEITPRKLIEIIQGL